MIDVRGLRRLSQILAQALEERLSRDLLEEMVREVPQLSLLPSRGSRALGASPEKILSHLTACSICLKILGASIVHEGVLAEISSPKPVHDLAKLLSSIEEGGLAKGLSSRGRDPFSWYLRVLDGGLAQAIRSLASHLRASGAVDEVIRSSSSGRDLVASIYSALVPRGVRKISGEFFTPEWAVDMVLRRSYEIAAREDPPRLVDPSCGTGSFLVKALARLVARRGQRDPCDLAGESVKRIVGVDSSSLAVVASRINYLAFVKGAAPACAEDLEEFKPPVERLDLVEDFHSLADLGRFSLVVGNPPWINWANLGRGYRERIAWLWSLYGLEPRGALGVHRKEISALIAYIAADKLLERGGILGILITQSVFKSLASSGFRRFELSGGEPLGVAEVHDLSDLRLFKDANNRPSILIAVKGLRTVYPVRYVKWLRGPQHPMPAELVAEPLRGPTGPWATLTVEGLRVLKKVLRRGGGGYRARSGVVTGLNRAYWVRILGIFGDLVRVSSAGSMAEGPEALVERDLVYPLLRGRDVGRWRASHELHIVLPVEPGGDAVGIEEMAEKYPGAYRWFSSWYRDLVERGGHPYSEILRHWRGGSGGRGAPFYTIFNLNHQLSKCKALWRYIADSLKASAVCEDPDPHTGRTAPYVLDCKLVFIPASGLEEAQYLAAVMNSSIASFTALSYGIETQLSTHIVENLGIERYDPDNHIHRRLSKLSQRAHELARIGGSEELHHLEEEIDSLVSELYGLTREEMVHVRENLRILRRAPRPKGPSSPFGRSLEASVRG